MFSHFKSLSLIQQLENAVVSNQTDVVEEILKKGVNPNDRRCGERNDGQFFLERAAQNNNTSIVKALIQHGADVNLTLEWACQRLRNRQYDIQTYQHIVKTILDYSVGVQLPEDFFDKRANIAGFNLIGAWIGNAPVSQQMLLSIPGYQDAIVSINQIDRLEPLLKEYICNLLEAKFKKEGKNVNNDGIANFLPLALAAMRGDIESVNARLSAGINANEVYKTGTGHSYHPIIEAAKRGYHSIVEMLLAAGVDTKYIVTAANEAKLQGHTELAEQLNSKVDKNSVDINGSTLLHLAVENCDIKDAEMQLKKGVDVNIINQNNQTSLELAISLYCTDRRNADARFRMVEVLLEATTNLRNDALKQAITKQSFIHEKGHNAKIVALLLPRFVKNSNDNENNNNSDNKSDWYKPFLFEAMCSKDRIEILTLFKEYGADFNTKVNNDGFHEASLLQILLSNFNYYTEKQKKSLLLLDYLLANGARADHINDQQQTLLYQLADNTYNNLEWDNKDDLYIEIISRLVKYGVDIDAKDIKGQTILDKAFEKDRKVLIQALRKMGAHRADELGNESNFKRKRN